MVRDAWQAGPARVGPLLAAQFDLDAGAVTVVLEGLVVTGPGQASEGEQASKTAATLPDSFIRISMSGRL